ncbi:hypothetical protein PsorP6_007100 [Peronosclerospora sorghi]|uniref:Uncharacterized protein n=1 Tax=Peronosclerospora sorghi TaxID=230839 RepID=A0ACC0WB60_9STRA|nr:hypothetical protein PsorP6_007100 [Peronosclerospora sorghi]
MMLPSLKLHVTVHRKSMAIHGHSKFTIEASPVVPQTGDHVLYNSRVTFVEPEATFMYWLVHGAGYLTIHHPKHKQPPRADTIQCLPASKFPFHAMLPALNTVERIASASIGGKALECASGHLFRTSVAGARLVLCASGTEGFMAYSSDWNVRVEYVSTRASIALPRGLTRPCEPIVQAQTVSRTALALLTGRDMPRPSSRQLKATEHMNMPHWACECKSKPRPCIFFHGIGNNHEMETVQSTPENTRHRMGNMNDHAPCCSTVKYAVLDTLTHSWTTDVLQQKFCDRALSVSPSSDQDQGLIGNTILVTHSMANLVMAMALSTGKCRFAQDSTWVAISGPMMGSMAADMAQSICHHDVMKAPFELFGLCPLAASRSSMFYEKGDLASDELKAMYAAAQEAYRGNDISLEEFYCNVMKNTRV